MLHNEQYLVTSRQVRRSVWILIAIAVLFVIAGFSMMKLSKTGVTYGQKCGGSKCWGYKVEMYRFPRRGVITIWGDWGLNLTFPLPPEDIEQYSEDHWLATDRAIYLNLRVKSPGDTASGDRIRFIYDYQAGATYLSSTRPLWRLSGYNSGQQAKGWLTDADLDAILTRIEP